MLKKALKGKLVEKYPGVMKKLTPKGQELLVDKLATKVTTEDEIEDFVNGLENTIEIFVDVVVSESDRRVREAGNKKPVNEAPEDGDGNDKPNNQEQGEAVPDWAKGLVSTVESLQQQLAQEKGKNTLADLVAAAKAKGIPEKFAGRYAIGEGFDQEAALAELESDWADLKQHTVNASVGEGRIPGGGAGTGSKDVSAAIKNFAKTNVESAAKMVAK